MKTVNEVIEKIEEIKDKDFFGFKTGDLIGYLPFNKAKQYLKPEVTEVTENEWKPQLLNKELIIKEMSEYMSFAWEKANNERGISAGRSMAHYLIWIWLIGDENEFDNIEKYSYYGKDHLVKICKHYGFKNEDDGERSNG